jgi:hypothetical protein
VAVAENTQPAGGILGHNSELKAILDMRPEVDFFFASLNRFTGLVET